MSSASSLYPNLRVPTRVNDVEGGAIFSKNSTFVFFDGAVGAAWTPCLQSPFPIMAPDSRTVAPIANAHIFCALRVLSLNLISFPENAARRAIATGESCAEVFFLKKNRSNSLFPQRSAFCLCLYVFSLFFIFWRITSQ